MLYLPQEQVGSSSLNRITQAEHARLSSGSSEESPTDRCVGRNTPFLPLLDSPRGGLRRRPPLVRGVLQRVQLLLVAGDRRIELRLATRLRLPSLSLRLPGEMAWAHRVGMIDAPGVTSQLQLRVERQCSGSHPVLTLASRLASRRTAYNIIPHRHGHRTLQHKLRREHCMTCDRMCTASAAACASTRAAFAAASSAWCASDAVADSRAARSFPLLWPP